MKRIKPTTPKLSLVTETVRQLNELGTNELKQIVGGRAPASARSAPTMAC